MRQTQSSLYWLFFLVAHYTSGFHSEAVTTKRALDNPDSINESGAKRRRDAPPIEDGYVVVYTDGACENNGQPNAKAGIGVWFSDENPMYAKFPTTET